MKVLVMCFSLFQIILFFFLFFFFFFNPKRWIKIYFTEDGGVKSGEITSYLLGFSLSLFFFSLISLCNLIFLSVLNTNNTQIIEKSRILEQSSEERSYHIFYYLLFGSSPSEKEKFQLIGFSFFY